MDSNLNSNNTWLLTSKTTKTIKFKIQEIKFSRAVLVAGLTQRIRTMVLWWLMVQLVPESTPTLLSLATKAQQLTMFVAHLIWNRTCQNLFNSRITSTATVTQSRLQEVQVQASQKQMVTRLEPHRIWTRTSRICRVSITVVQRLPRRKHRIYLKVLIIAYLTMVATNQRTIKARLVWIICHCPSNNNTLRTAFMGIQPKQIRAQPGIQVDSNQDVKFNNLQVQFRVAKAVIMLTSSTQHLLEELVFLNSSNQARMIL